MRLDGPNHKPRAEYRIGATCITVVGDDPSLKVPMAHRGGALAVAVNTGVGRLIPSGISPKQRPRLTVHDVGELLSLYKGHR
jgi:NagD protein